MSSISEGATTHVTEQQPSNVLPFHRYRRRPVFESGLIEKSETAPPINTESSTVEPSARDMPAGSELRPTGTTPVPGKLREPTSHKSGLGVRFQAAKEQGLLRRIMLAARNRRDGSHGIHTVSKRALAVAAHKGK